MSTSFYFFLCICLGISCTIALLLISYRHLSYLIKNKRYSPLSLLKDFNQKMWMTIGLGVPFFGFYFFGVSFIANWLDVPTGLHVFFLVYEQPILFIYFGLFLFALFSLMIYFMRMLIKYLYLTRKDR